jgi:hypothetical protein
MRQLAVKSRFVCKSKVLLNIVLMCLFICISTSLWGESIVFKPSNLLDGVKSIVVVDLIENKITVDFLFGGELVEIDGEIVEGKYKITNKLIMGQGVVFGISGTKAFKTLKSIIVFPDGGVTATEIDTTKEQLTIEKFAKEVVNHKITVLIDPDDENIANYQKLLKAVQGTASSTTKPQPKPSATPAKPAATTTPKPTPKPAAPTAKVENVWVDHNVIENGTNGMKIHVKFSVEGMLNKQGQCAAYFHYATGAVLKDTNNRYATTTGDVASNATTFKPTYENSIYNDFVIFMPYDEMDLRPGSYDLKFNVGIFDDNRKQIALSDYVNFTYNNSGKTVQNNVGKTSQDYNVLFTRMNKRLQDRYAEYKRVTQWVGESRQGQHTDIDFPMLDRHNYMILGDCDDDCTDLDLILYEMDGRTADSDTLDDPFPIVEHVPSGSSTHRVRVIMKKCETNTCQWLVQAMER